ncbi:reverse transcriptase [Gossypium australe]|uniref:Reverse transcriptase n=1 Tax=Gossypium australe TaxID=47621 RepID=A0A5B6WD11_9ROSI|nr:reverse transcriptase [Gossypium australe]
MEQSCEEEVKRLWEMSRGGVKEKLEYVGKGLQRWAWVIKKSRKGLSTKLLTRITELDELERMKENLEELIDVKIHLNLENDTEESKAYDRVEWEFIERVMQKMSFADAWVSLIMKCVKIVTYAVCMKNEMGESFKPMQ